MRSSLSSRSYSLQMHINTPTHKENVCMSKEDEWRRHWPHLLATILDAIGRLKRLPAHERTPLRELVSFGALCRC